MNAIPIRAKVPRIPFMQPHDEEADGAWFIGPIPTRRRLLRPLRAIRIGIQAVVWTALSLAVQSLLILVPGRAKAIFPRIFWSVMCGMLSMRIRVIGEPADRAADGRPVVFVSNHSSWLDIPVLGARLEASFIAKQEIGKWPVVSLVAKLGRTLYVRRSRASTGRERDEMLARLQSGGNLILFPEGTSSDGSRVLPFRSAFLSVAELPVTADGRPPLVQPVSIVYDRLAGLPTGRASRPLFAWYGDMDLGSHFWRLAQHRGLRATILFHEPLDPAAFASRKELTRVVWQVAADGASTLRQNRKATPITAAAAPAEPASPVFA